MALKKIIGVCYCGIAAEYQEEICNDIIAYANEHGDIGVVFFTCFINEITGTTQDIGEFRVFDLINWDKLDAMMILGQVMPDHSKIDEIANAAKEHGVPCVCIDWETDSCPCVLYRCDNTIFMQTEHLIKEHGCRKINFLAGAKGNKVSEERENGYRRALEANGIPVEEDRIAVGGWWTEGTEAIVEDWLDRGVEIDAVVCANDIMALSAVRIFRRHGLRVPEDVKVTGIDMIEEGRYMEPQLSTADFDRKKDVALAFDILFGKIEETVYLEPDIIYSESCGCRKSHHEDINEMMRKLQTFNDRLLLFTRKNNSLESKIIEQPDWKSALEMIRHDTSEQWVKKLWLCVNSDFIRTKLDDIDNPQLGGYAAPGGYTKEQRIIAYKDSDDMHSGQVFPTSELIPDFDEAIDYCKFILVFPLHINDASIGYGVREISEFSELERWYLYARSVSNALMIVKQENDLTLSNKMLEEMYNRDSMTRLYNRRGFFKNLSKLLENKSGDRFVVISIDMDGLKSVNDNFGHVEGDTALIVLAGIISQLSGREFISARFGGDEFLAAGFVPEGRGAEFEIDLQKKIERYNEMSGKPYKLSASTGRIEREFSPDDDFDNMIMLADEIMYRSKADKKGSNFRGAYRGKRT